MWVGVGVGVGTGANVLTHLRVRCTSDSSNTPSGRGFGRQSSNKDNNNNNNHHQRTSTTNPRTIPPPQAPALRSSSSAGKRKGSVLDAQFYERLDAVRRSAIEQRKAAESKEYGPIDYDAPVEPKDKSIGIGTKVGVGVAVVVFGLLFALGDFLPSESSSPSEEAAVAESKLSKEEKVALQVRLRQYEETLTITPKDPIALEGAAVTLAELGDYSRAESLLEDLVKDKRSDPDAFRLLGEVKYELKDYEGSAAAYKSATTVSKTINFEVLRGLTNALLAAHKPDEAVQILLASRKNLSEKSVDGIAKSDNTAMDGAESEKIDPIQVDLLLGKAYSDWGHVSDAITVYNQLISSYPNDFRGFLAKGIILKENRKIGEAERMFIQARFLAPEKAKALVDRYSRR